MKSSGVGDYFIGREIVYITRFWQTTSGISQCRFWICIRNQNMASAWGRCQRYRRNCQNNLKFFENLIKLIAIYPKTNNSISYICARRRVALAEIIKKLDKSGWNLNPLLRSRQDLDEASMVTHKGQATKFSRIYQSVKKVFFSLPHLWLVYIELVKNI